MATDRSALPIRAVSRLTGLSIDTLRAWERRYGAVVPTRGPRGRTYDLAQVSRLRSLETLVRRGHAIGTIAHLSDGQLDQLRSVADGGMAAAHPSPVGIDLKGVFEAVDRFDWPAIEAALSRFAAMLPARQFVIEVAMPLMREVGERWAAGSLSIAQEHLVSGIVRTVSGGLLHSASRPYRRPVVFATPAGERHELGALCAAVMCAAEGWDARYAGPDLPADDIAAMAQRSPAAAIVLGVTIEDPRPVVRRVRQLVPEIPLLLGGAAAHGPAMRIKGVHLIEDLAVLDAQLRAVAG